MTVRVLIIDDSAIVRKVLSNLLCKDPGIDVVGTAPDPFVGRDKILRCQPDVLLLDVEMPRMDGISFLKKLMAHRPMPVLIVSSLTPKGSDLALRALAAGAVDVLCKPHGSYTMHDLGPDLIEKIKAAAKVQVKPRSGNLEPQRLPELAATATTHRIVSIGASTGGTTAIEEVLRALPASAPGIVIVQHMPEKFTAAFAKRLNTVTAVTVKEAEEGDLVAPGRVLVAPGNAHLVLRRSGALYRAGLLHSAPVSRHRPSIDVLFDSVAQNAGQNAVGILLTGMGEDGAEGLLHMRQCGARTVAQDEASSVVYGMPKAAVDRDAAEHVLPLEQVASALLHLSTSHHTHPSVNDGRRTHACPGG